VRQVLFSGLATVLATVAAETALILDRLLFRPDISQVGADRASVMRCRWSLMLAGGRCRCCHCCCQPRSGEWAAWRDQAVRVVREPYPGQGPA